MPIRMLELFAGIGATRQAMEDLNLDYESVGISEIDATAVKGYEAIHGSVKNYGDITKMETLPEVDLLTYSYPCQSVSIAGRQEGMKEGSGTKSALLWEVKRLLSDCSKLPEVLLMENVDGVLSKRNYKEFERWLIFLSELGYTSTYGILNAKDYGTPQHRRRLFTVSTLTRGAFVFPEKRPDGRVLRDVLEENVDESYYLSEDRVNTFIRHKKRNDAKGNGFGFKIRDLDKPAVAITTNPDRYCSNWIATPKIELLGSLQLKGRHESALRVYGAGGLSPCIPAGTGGGLMPKIEDLDYSKLRIRYLTPRECLRLQDFPEEAIDRLMREIPAKTNLYKLAGNSIPVCLLRAIFKGVYLDNSFIKTNRQISLNTWEE